MKQPFLASDRAFGLLFGLLLLAVALWPWWQGGPLRLWALLTAAALLAISWRYPTWLAPLNRLWLMIGQLLHRIMSPLIMAVIFGCLFVPVGLWRRLLRRDPLRLRIDPQADSYWLGRDPQEFKPESMKYQF
ncbi:MAG: hypothetical protein HQL60_06945 [Magnetococcales bacterium]|nr:hypothetical protein [Magnetococcales bacterium]